MDYDVVEEIRQAIERPGDPDQPRITDLHVWCVGKNTYSCAVGVVTHGKGVTPEWVCERLSVHEEIVHTTIEIYRYP